MDTKRVKLKVDKNHEDCVNGGRDNSLLREDVWRVEVSSIALLALFHFNGNLALEPSVPLHPLYAKPAISSQPHSQHFSSHFKNQIPVCSSLRRTKPPPIPDQEPSSCAYRRRQKQDHPVAGEYSEMGWICRVVYARW